MSEPDLLGETLRRTVKARLSAATLSQADAAAFVGVSEKHLSRMLTGAVDGSLAMWERLLTFVNARLVEEADR